MKISRTVLFHRTRDRRFLIRSALVIAGVSLLIGAAISKFTAKSGFHSLLDDFYDFEETPELLANPEARSKDIHGWATLIRSIAELKDESGGDFHHPGMELEDLIDGFVGDKEAPEDSKYPFEILSQQLAEAEELSPEDRELLTSLARGLLRDETAAEKASEELRKASARRPPRRLAAEFLGDVCRRTGDWDGAIEAYGDEVDRFPDQAHRALHWQVVLLRREGRLEDLNALLNQPDLSEHVSIFDRIDLAVERRDYAGLLGLVIRHDFSFKDSWLVVLSLFSAAVWFIIITQFSGAWRAKGLWYLAAFVLGYFSATATLYAVLLQEGVLNFTHNPQDDLVQQIIYCIAGIGLREETLKLFLFLPLVPFLAKRGNEIDALICAGLVGLGFAFNENTGYVGRGSEFETWGRFLTANFLHIALTGVAGLSLVRAWRWPKRQWDNFLYDFLIVVAAHGAYDALLMVPQLMGYEIIGIIIYAVVAYLFLDQATHLMRPQSSMTISPLAVFIIGSALLMGVVLCFACWAVPFPYAIAQYTSGLGGMIPIAFIFINRLRVL